MKIKTLLVAVSLTALCSCSKFKDLDFWIHHDGPFKEDPSTFKEVASLDIGEAGAAEISAYDPITQRLFVVNNGGTNKIDVLDLNNLNQLAVIASISLDKYQGAVNSLDVHNGMLAAAIESKDKQQNGKAVIFNTADYSEIKSVGVGALPDMITFSPDGKYILTANEGEPNADYTIDPLGTVSIIDVKNGFQAVTINFSAFEGKKQQLQKKGFRVFGPGASVAQDVEPEYITVSEDSRTAWVTLQENNAIAKIDLTSKKVSDIFPLGFKSYAKQANAIDPSDKDNQISFRSVPVFGMYQPDAIAVLQKFGKPFLFTVNEGDVREYDGFAENKRVKDIDLDPVAFPGAEALKKDDVLGRLNITTTLGVNKDGKYEALYSFGARSFSVWDGFTGQQLFDCGNSLEKAVAEKGYYDDGRSDDKGVEPEGIALGEIGSKDIAFIGMERADAVAVYDVTSPTSPRLLQILKSGDAPEGVLFINAKESPIKKSLLVVSSEDDGVVKIYTPAE